MVNEGGKIVVAIDPDLLDLIPGYLDNRHKDIKTVQQALMKKDYETIRILGHSMKGSGGGYGFDAITDLGRSMEQAAKEGNAGEVMQVIQQLQRYLERVEIVSQ